MRIFNRAGVNLAGAVLAATSLAGAAQATDLRISCYSDGVECEVTADLAKRFTEANPDIHITVDKVAYKVIQESLPVQLAAGNGPDIARVTDFGAISKYFLDMRPLLPDAPYWEANFGQTLPWMQATPDDHGVYGLPTQLTITGPIVNKTLFDQAGVPMPGPKATWDDWAAATRKVAAATKTDFGLAMDRTGHRFASGAISYGAKYFAPDGTPIPVDDGFKAFASRWVGWNEDGTAEKEVWAAAGGGAYRDAFEDFANGRVVAYVSGSWQVSRLQSAVGDGFDWVIAPPFCGPAACTPMPGGASFVAFKSTRSPKEVARFLDYLASEPVYREMTVRTANIPAHQGLQKSGVTYDQSAPRVAAALGTFTKAANDISPVAYKLQGYIYNRPIFTSTAARLSQVIVGELTLDQAYARIDSDVQRALAAAK